jgi:hypothetical protein
MTLAAVMTGLQIFGGISQYSAAQKAADDARKAGEANAQLAELEGEEKIRRYEKAQRQLQGKMVVSYAKAGVVLQGTPLEVMAEAANEAEREASFMREQTARTATARRMGTNAQADSLQSQGTSMLISSLGTAAKTAYDNNLWDIG